METFFDITSFLSIPSFLGNPPTMIATLTPVQASTTSVVATTPEKPIQINDIFGHQFQMYDIFVINKTEKRCQHFIDSSHKEQTEQKVPLRRGNAASTSSILTPFNDSAAGGMSSMCKITG